VAERVSPDPSVPSEGGDEEVEVGSTYGVGVVAGETPKGSFDKGRDREQTAAVLQEWLSLQTNAKVAISNVGAPSGAGISNETILFDAEIDDGTTVRTEELVLRVSPDPEMRLFKSTLFETQARLLRTLRSGGYARVPDVRWYEEDPKWFDRPFFVMQQEHGRVPISEPVYNSTGWLFDATPEQRRIVWESAFDEMIRIHRVPTDVVRFLPGGEAAGSAFTHVLDAVRDEYGWACAGVQHPKVDHLWEWLDANVPPSPPDGLSWGDARIGNMMFDDDFELVVVMDWEAVTLGGSILDLGWWLFFDDLHGASHPRLEGLGGRSESIERWEAATSLSAEHVAWYEILAAVRLAAVAIRGMAMIGLESDDRNVFVRLAYEKLGWGDLD
jgi:aminoglycoside phosphotransferase (APT) family kinase protein